MSDLAWMRPKLAELCGLSLTGLPEMKYVAKANGFPDYEWKPWEDVAQAVRCLEAMPLPYMLFMRNLGRSVWRVTIDDCADKDWVGQDASLSRAICLAIQAAMGWTEGDGNP